MRRILFCSLILTTLLFLSCRQKDKKTNNQLFNSFESIIPERPIGWVSDYEYVFRTHEIAYLDSMIANHNKQTTNEIAVVTLMLDTFSIKTPKDFDQLSRSLFNKWGIGEKDKKNRVGILFSIKLSQLRIEVGTGLETKLTDEEAKKIIDTIIFPEFKNASYFTGISKGLEAIFKEIQ